MNRVGKVIWFGIAAVVLLVIGAWLNDAGSDRAAAKPPKVIRVTATPEPAPTVTETLPATVRTVVPEPEAEFGDGVYLVGEDIEAGSYKTRGPVSDDVGDSCSWSRNRDDSGEFEAIIANAILTGPGRVTLKKGEIFEVSGGCEWVKP